MLALYYSCYLGTALTQCRAALRLLVGCRAPSPPALDSLLLHLLETGSLFWCECAPPWDHWGHSTLWSKLTIQTILSHHSLWILRRPGRSLAVSPESTGWEENKVNFYINKKQALFKVENLASQCPFKHEAKEPNWLPLLITLQIFHIAFLCLPMW